MSKEIKENILEYKTKEDRAFGRRLEFESLIKRWLLKHFNISELSHEQLEDLIPSLNDLLTRTGVGVIKK